MRCFIIVHGDWIIIIEPHPYIWLIFVFSTAFQCLHGSLD